MISLELPKTREGDVLDITPILEAEVVRSGRKEGALLVFIAGSTAGLTTVEHEPGLVKDMSTAMERIAPRNAKYAHDEAWHDGNGHSHVRASLVGPSLTIPISGGKLVLGQWQHAVLLEFDNKPRRRTIHLQFLD